MGDTAALSPIDITLESEKPEFNIELAALDKFMDFAQDARKGTERVLEGHHGKGSTVESELLVEMVRQVGALNVGKFYRERELTGEYAKQLLTGALFAGAKAKDAEPVVRHFLFGAPAHAFHMDSKMCRARGLPIQDMTTEESDQAKEIVMALQELTLAGIICKKINQKRRAPFFYYETSISKKGGAGLNVASQAGKRKHTARAGRNAKTSASGNGVRRRTLTASANQFR